MIVAQDIDEFFSRYASMMNNALFGEKFDISILQHSFASFVVGASPAGLAGGVNDGAFQTAIKHGIDFYKRIGITFMNIASRDVTILDDLHAMVKVYWKSFYVQDSNSGEIPFEVYYLLQGGNDGLKIFAYITGDEQAVLRSHNLIP